MELEINSTGKTGKSKIMWKLSDILLDNQWVKEYKRESRKYLEENENKSTTYHNLWDAEKAVLTGKFIAIKACI